jgi:uroporphyrinogen-III synthase
MEAAASLKGMTVLLTRPAGQSNTLAQAIHQLGGEVCELPLIEIDPVVDVEACERIKSYILDLDQYEAAIFVSTNAARLGMQWIDRYWPQLPAGLSAYAVGPATAELLQTFDWPVYYSDKGVTSEELLALPGLKQIQGQRIALIRGVGGRELIAETLRERGARVDYIELYRRHTPDYTRDMLAELIGSKGVNAVVCTSAQILDVLLHALHQNPQALQTIPVLVPSERVRQLGLAAGLSRVINAGGVADEAIIHSLLAVAATAG